jgi:hypothetical protein
MLRGDAPRREISNQVDRNPQKPGRKRAFATEGCALLEGPEKAFLREGVRSVGVFDQQEDHPVNAPLVLTNDFVEAIRRDGFRRRARR